MQSPNTLRIILVCSISGSWLGSGCGTSKHNCLVSYLLCWRRHVSAIVGHLQVTKIYIKEVYTEYDYSIGSYSKLSMRSHQLHYTHWAKSTSSKWGIQLTPRYHWKFRICTYTIIILCTDFLYTFLWHEDGPQWLKNVITSIINRIQDSCVLTYPTPYLIAYNTTGMMHLEIWLTIMVMHHYTV